MMMMNVKDGSSPFFIFPINALSRCRCTTAKANAAGRQLRSRTLRLHRAHAQSAPALPLLGTLPRLAKTKQPRASPQTPGQRPRLRRRQDAARRVPARPPAAAFHNAATCRGPMSMPVGELHPINARARRFTASPLEHLSCRQGGAGRCQDRPRPRASAGARARH